MNDKKLGIHEWLEQETIISFCIHKKKHYGATLIAKLKSVQMLETPGQSCVYTH